MFSCLWNYISDEFLVVSLPRTLVLRNKRLGTLNKFLQVAFIAMATAYCVVSRVFLLSYPVEAWGVNIWPVDGSSSNSSSNSSSTQDAQYCTNPAAYAYMHESSATHYEPTSCKALSAGEAYSNLMDGAVFVTTFAADNAIWQGAGNDCGPSAEKECAARNGIWAATYQEAGGTCSCTIHEQFLVQNAEQQRVRLVYGFEVDLSGGRRLDIYRGGIVAPTTSRGPQHALKQSTSDLETTFIATDGKQCQFGGKSTWQLSEAVGGISGTLHELLNCAGVTLDSNPESLVAGASLPFSPPHLRTQGVRLELHMNIQEDLFGRISCDIRVVATPVTTAVWTGDVQPWGGGGSAGMTKAQHSRRAQGVALSARVRGTIYTFSWIQVVRGCVDVIVVLHVPHYIVYFIAMYLLGLISEVYRNAAQARFNVFNHFHSSVAKLILSEVAFRGIVGDFESDMHDLPGMTPNMLFYRLQDIFKHYVDSGVLSMEEVMGMCAVTFNVMDKDANGEIACAEFIEASTDDGEINLNRLAMFFDNDQNIGVLRRLLDDTHSISRKTAALKRLRTCELRRRQTTDKRSFKISHLGPELENRVRKLELYCDEAVEALRAAVILQPPVVQVRHGSHTAEVAAWVPVLAGSPSAYQSHPGPGSSSRNKNDEPDHDRGEEGQTGGSEGADIALAVQDVSVEHVADTYMLREGVSTPTKQDFQRSTDDYCPD